jgi:type II secretory pathway pseudopilin PulG
MYKIIGSDGKEYGPVSAEQIQKWLREGRVDVRTSIVREGTTEWRPLGEFPELTPPAVAPSSPVEQPVTDGKAIGSMVCGIVSFVIPVLVSIPAVILGHMSRAAIRKSMGRLTGDGMALAGLIMGYISLAFTIPIIIVLIVATIAIPSLLRSRQAANESAAVANLRTINTAEVTYLSTSGGTYGELEDLIDTGLLDTRFHGDVSGYRFTIIADGAEYFAEAEPVTANTGRFGYYSTPDGVVRYSITPSLAPSGLSGIPVQ